MPGQAKDVGRGGRTAGIKEVAARAGVSVGTVSNVLNRPEHVSAATRGRVEKAVADLGFVRNESARLLRAGRSRVLAYVVLDAMNPFFTDVAHGIELAAERADLLLFLCNSDNDRAREQRYLSRLQEQRVQGVLITPVDADDPSFKAISAQGTPLVVVDRVRSTDNGCSVAVNDDLGGRLAATHLLDRGHRNIAFVGGPVQLGQVRDRLDGAVAAVEESGPGAELTVMATEGLTVAEGRGAGERLAGLPASLRPTAAFCANDLLALGLLQSAVSMGIDVPRDLAIVGYDDIEFAAAAAVPLTSVRQPRRDLGRRATQLLVDEATNADHRHEQVLFTPELVARASTRRI